MLHKRWGIINPKFPSPDITSPTVMLMIRAADRENDIRRKRWEFIMALRGVLVKRGSDNNE